jgi:predicted TIM-barrel fold metal-dependent hydrolase
MNAHMNAQRTIRAAALLFATAAVTNVQVAVGPPLPLANHHMHLVSPAAAKLLTDPIPGAASAAEQLIAQMDEADIKRGVVLSTAYWFASTRMRRAPGDEYENVRAENDWTAREAARFKERLVAFCSFNPLTDYALKELERCSKHPYLKGVKLHFGNSGVDVRNRHHVQKLTRIFASANERRLPIVVHLWSGGDYGREQAEIFLNEILPAAQDITVQIAHFAGGGPGYTDEALAVFAEAVVRGDPRTNNLYFDVASVADGQPADVLATFAMRIRQVGIRRVLFGTDVATSMRQSWTTFSTTVPLTEPEFRMIAANMAPYLR